MEQSLASTSSLTAYFFFFLTVLVLQLHLYI